MRLSYIGLKYARTFVYLLGVLILLFSPYRAQLFSLSPLLVSLVVILFYILIAVWLQVKGTPVVLWKANRLIYALDTLAICWVISLTGGIDSPLYPFMFLPVIFISFEYGLKTGLIFGVFATIVGTFALLSASVPRFNAFLVYASTIFFLALTAGLLKDTYDKRIKREEVLNALRALLLQDLEPQEAIAKALEILGRAMEADIVVYLHYDEENRSLKFPKLGYGIRREEERLLEREIPLEEGGVSIEVFQTGEPLLIENTRRHPQILKDIVDNFRVGSAMSFPINIMGRRWGVFHFWRRWNSLPFNEEDFQTAKELVGEGLAVLEVMEQRREVEKRRDLLEVLTKLISNLSRAMNIEEVGREVFYTLKEVIPDLEDVVLVKCKGNKYSAAFYQSKAAVHSTLIRSAFEKVREGGKMISIPDEGKGEEGVIAVPVFEGGDITHILLLFLNPLRSLSEDARTLILTTAAEMSTVLSRVYSVAELERYAYHDPLTRLLNRRMFYQRMGREIKGARRYGYPISFAILDIDDFKKYNDTYGHLEGDRILAELGRILKEEIRASDFAARIGGEEFAIVLPHTPKDSAVPMVDRLMKRVKEKLGISVSIGVGEFPSDANTLRGLMRRVDEVLYEAKKLGKGRIQVVAKRER